ncbi:hypothetical protein E2C01_064130 [Portunus trituberculatus]|uniref:Uncharacterized protein n=1 Tax=Portunus trituberculatus TaxID=210409 RepID=A0A5B7HKW6_PORTR|nr:hypothetical protein [Portunus trituberculatus]
MGIIEVEELGVADAPHTHHACSLSLGGWAIQVCERQQNAILGAGLSHSGEGADDIKKQTKMTARLTRVLASISQHVAR